jgi:hypothetical protein
MVVFHHGLRIELPDPWWAEAEMAGFVPRARTFRPDVNAEKGVEIFEASVEDVAPLKRAPGVGIFNDNKEATARERVVRILRGFREGAQIPPIHLTKLTPAAAFRYKIGNGSHRFYCSLAAGFSHVPAFEGYGPDGPI